jgi:metastasis-associated protein MTA
MEFLSRLKQVPKMVRSNWKFQLLFLEKTSEVKEPEYGLAGLPRNAEKLEANQIHKLRQHELFLSRQVDTLPATQIRGKCTVVMLSEVETCDSYLNREDSFFYSLVFDGTNQTLLADKGKIEVGEKYQADIPDMLPQSVIDRERGLENCEKEDEQENGNLEIDEPKVEDESTEKKPLRERRYSQNINGVYETRYESVVYHPNHNLTDRDIDQFLIIAR